MNNNPRSGQSIVEYILVIALVAVVIAVALITMGEDKEEYVTEPDHPELIEEETEQQ